MKDLAEKGSTLFLRLAIVGMAIVALGLCALILPNIYWHWAEEFTSITYTTYPIIVGLVLVACAFWTALYQAWKLLGYIDQDTLFTKPTLGALNIIKYCAGIIGLLFALGWPVIYHWAQVDDAPGLIVIYGVIFIGAPLVAAVAIAVLQKLLQKVLFIKKENDLTV